MKISSHKHVLFTWLLANTLQLLVIAFFLFDESDTLEFIQTFLLIGLISFGLSIPCMVVAYFCFDLIVNAALPVRTRFLIWMVLCPFLVLAEGVAILLIMGESDLNSLVVCVPGMLSAFFAVILRFREFYSFVSQTKISTRI